MRLSSILWGIAALFWFLTGILQTNSTLAIADICLAAVYLFLAGFSSLEGEAK